VAVRAAANETDVGVHLAGDTQRDKHARQGNAERHRQTPHGHRQAPKGQREQAEQRNPDGIERGCGLQKRARGEVKGPGDLPEQIRGAIEGEHDHAHGKGPATRVPVLPEHDRRQRQRREQQRDIGHDVEQGDRSQYHPRTRDRQRS